MSQKAFKGALDLSRVVPSFRAFRGSILKRAFLEACLRAGLFDAIAMEGATPRSLLSLTNRMIYAITRIERASNQLVYRLLE